MMKAIMSRRLPQIVLLAFAVRAFAADLPTEWVDPDTGHRVIRLSREDGTQSLYFHQNAYTPDGRRLIVTTANGGIATIDLATREIKPLVAGPVSVLVAGHKTGDVYYTRRAEGADAGSGSIVYAAKVDTGVSRQVVKLPPGRSVASLNADEPCCSGPMLRAPLRKAVERELRAAVPTRGSDNRTMKRWDSTANR
jgi:oligogalacturonide lyase